MNMLKLNLNNTTLKVEVIEQTDIVVEQAENQLVVSHCGKRVIDCLKVHKDGNSSEINLACNYENIYGLGERFDRVNQKGKTTHIEIIEKFCNQGELSYCPIPFFMTDSGFGVYVDTMAVSDFTFDERITIKTTADSQNVFPTVYLFIGIPKEILSQFSHLTGQVKLPPKWAFGIWGSANRWNKDTDVAEQLAKIEETKFPLNVLVLEAWSDECTFYLWNGSENTVNDGSKPAEEIRYEKALWKDPKGMIDKLHEKNIKLILWQIPVLKLLTPDLQSQQHDNDCAFAEANKLCVQNRDGTPYVIPEGHWFAGSVIPDFTNPETLDWWFSKRQYLLDMGVDGFKTDGGEFIYTDDTIYKDGTTSLEMKNGYAKSYVKAYTDFVGEYRVLFSRAGYTGQHSFPIQWAGDQQSTWEEFRNILTAGLSAGLSGIAFWSYDIGGFAGPLPTVELYERSTQMAVFCPVMQWHSEPSGGQFAELMPSAKGINDRSPWNMATAYGDVGLLERLRFHYNLRTNLLPYLFLQAMESAKTGLPMLRHLVLEYPLDAVAAEIDDQFMLGDIMVAPVLETGKVSRRVYLPAGDWQDFYTRERIPGGQWLEYSCGRERIPAFVRKGGVVALNLGEDLTLGSPVGNATDGYQTLCFLVTELHGHCHFADDLGNDFELEWTDEKYSIKGECHVEIILLK